MDSMGCFCHAHVNLFIERFLCQHWNGTVGRALNNHRLLKIIKPNAGFLQVVFLITSLLSTNFVCKASLMTSKETTPTDFDFITSLFFESQAFITTIICDCQFAHIFNQLRTQRFSSLAKAGLKSWDRQVLALYSCDGLACCMYCAVSRASRSIHTDQLDTPGFYVSSSRCLHSLLR